MKHELYWYFSAGFYEIILGLVQAFDASCDEPGSFRLALEAEYKPLGDEYWKDQIEPILLEFTEKATLRADIIWARVLK